MRTAVTAYLAYDGQRQTLTSFKASTLMKDNPDIDKCLFVVDRKDLDRQTSEEFNKFQENCVEEGVSMNGLVTISREVPAPRSGSGAARARNSDETKAAVAVTPAADAGRVSDGRLLLAGAEDPAGEKTQRS